MNMNQEIIEVLDKLRRLAAIQNEEIVELRNQVRLLANALTTERELHVDYSALINVKKP